MMNRREVLKLYCNDYEVGKSTRDSAMSLLTGASLLMLAIAWRKEIELDETEFDNALNAFVNGVGELVVRQSYPDIGKPLAPLPDGPLNDLSELALATLAALRSGSRVNESTLLFLAEQVCNGVGVDFKERLAMLVAGMKRTGQGYPPQEPGEPDAGQGAP